MQIIENQMTQTMKLSYDQSLFLMECMRYYMNNQEFDFTDEDFNVILTAKEIQQLYNDIQDRKF